MSVDLRLKLVRPFRERVGNGFERDSGRDGVVRVAASGRCRCTARGVRRTGGKPKGRPRAARVCRTRLGQRAVRSMSATEERSRLRWRT